jgi:hypothetical protein
MLSIARPLYANPSMNPQAALNDGRVAYERGDYEIAIRTLRPLLYPTIELGNEEAVVEAHRLLALSYLLSRKEPLAEEEATSLFAIRPTFELDPVVDPPVAVRFFEGVRKRQEIQLSELRRRQQEESERARKEEELRRKEARAKAERIFVDRLIERHSRLIAMIPFGVGQAQNGQPKKAIGFAVAELLMGALSLASYVAIDQRYQTFDPQTHLRSVPKSDYTTAQTLLGLELGSGIAFWGIVAWGIIDAQVLFKKEVLVKARELPSPPKPPRVSIIPTVMPGGFALSLKGAF